METLTRLPAYPLVTSDPYVSIWSCADTPTEQDTRHWAGERKRMVWTLTVDGTPYALLGRQEAAPTALTDIRVTPTRTEYTYAAGGVTARLSFRAPLLLDDLDLLSMPVTFLSLQLQAADGKTHAAASSFTLHDDLCYDGLTSKPMLGSAYASEGLSIATMGQRRQNILGHSGDHITIDWGYAYLAGEGDIDFVRAQGHWALNASFAAQVDAQGATHAFLLGYDDIFAIQYFGFAAKAWYTRDGRGIVDALRHCHGGRADIDRRCDALDAQLLADARRVGGESYAAIVAAGYRQTIAAHKLIADEAGSPVFLSKENDSNGCLGTADVSYPSIPLYLLYAPALVNAMCRPVLRFAALPVWRNDFAPHDVGRYPHATGQVYGLRRDAFGSGISDPVQNGDVYPPLYQYAGPDNLYDDRYQMPVEECGNMLLMLAAALRAEGDEALIRAHRPLLDTWAAYLATHGADPGEQLCTDDFAGHLAHNVNLAIKAACGVRAYAMMMARIGDAEAAVRYEATAHEMARTILNKARRGDHTALTLNGDGWSLKYNAIWSLLFGWDLWDKAFFEDEIAQYQRMQNVYGVPLDARADYTKSDWILWCAAMSDDPAVVEGFCAPIVRYLAETSTRVPFSDWYDTQTGRYCHFINRSVQGGLFMPLLRERWCT